MHCNAPIRFQTLEGTMKKTLLVLLTLVMAFRALFLASCAGSEKMEPEEATAGLTYILNDTGKAYTLAGIGNATDTKIVVASKYNGKNVTAIAPDAFSGCTQIVEVSIPGNVTTIGEGAFAGCTSLEKISIKSKLTTIGAGAFYNCTKLERISLPTNVKNIGAMAFYNCKSLESISINEKSNIVSIGDKTFYGCESLTSIAFPKAVTTFGASVLEGCTSLTSLEAPFVGANKEGGENAHLGYLFGSSNNAGVPASLESVRLTNANNVGAAAFSGCTGIVDVVLDKGISIIGNSAFKGCTGLVEIVVPSSVSNIGSKAFEGCTSLESLTIPFVGASKEEARSYYLGYIFGASKYQENPEFVPASLKEVVVTYAKTIEANAFWGCSNLTDVTVEGTVERIGAGAFEGCESMESMTLPFVGASSNAKEAYTYFGYIFGGTSYTENYLAVPETLKSVEITNATRIESNAFAGCASIENIEFSDSVATIGESAFYDTAFYNDDANWTDGVLYMNNILVTVKEDFTGACTIKSNVVYIAEAAFKDCEGLTEVFIPKSVTCIDKAAFVGCVNLEAATFENAVKGWQAGSTALSVEDISNTEKAAEILTNMQYKDVQIHFSAS